MRRMIVVWISFVVFLLSGVSNQCMAKNIHIVFLNPGESTEKGTGAFWRMVTDFMQEAAHDLNIQLEVLYAERNHLHMRRQAKDVAQRATSPDYVIFVNEKMSGVEMLTSLKDSGAKLIVLHNSLMPEQYSEIGAEREQISNWIGTVTSDNAQAGYKLIKELARYVTAAPKVVAITGERATPVSSERVQGLQSYMRERPEMVLYQVINAHWSYEDGRHRARVVDRYPDLNILWAANDAMALGAYEELHLLKPGIIVGGMGGFPDALVSIQKDQLKATIGGHFMIGAWALVLLYDYHYGADFVTDEGSHLKLDYLFVINKKNLAQYIDLIVKNPASIDFRQFSKMLNPDLRTYNFTYDMLLQQLE